MVWRSSLFILLVSLASHTLCGQTDSNLLHHELAPKSELELLTEDEQEVIYWVNFVRVYPSEFLNEVVIPHLDTAEVNEAYAQSLRSTLEKQSQLKRLDHHPTLTELAKSHAENMGAKGDYGHARFNQRTQKAMLAFDGLAENCNYATYEPLLMVLSLLIDENVPNLGHRNTILSSTYTYIGVAIAPHSDAGIQCVQEFGGEILD